MESSSPSPPARPIAAYRSYWLPELAALFTVAVGATVVFSATGLDIAAARRFYAPDPADPWPVAGRPLWLALYHSTPWITGSLVGAGAALLLAGLVRASLARLRLYGLFVLLCVIVGPGLIINAALKDHWGRPRPREIAQFGGKMTYSQPLLPAGGHGKSFPCGHCSVGYLYAIGWWIWRRRRPLWAASSLAFGLAAGTLLGLGRMAAGGHFLSDAVWSCVIALGTAHGLYYYVLRIPSREDRRAPGGAPATEGHARLKPARIGAALAIAAAAMGSGVISSWRFRDLAARVPPGSLASKPERVEVIADTLDVEIDLVNAPAGQFECAGDVHGFGLPASEIRAGWTLEDRPVPTLRYRVEETGRFLYLDGAARIRIPASLRTLVVRVGHGNIVVVDETGSGAAGRHPGWNLRSADGSVTGP